MWCVNVDKFAVLQKSAPQRKNSSSKAYRTLKVGVGVDFGAGWLYVLVIAMIMMAYNFVTIQLPRQQAMHMVGTFAVAFLLVSVVAWV